MIAAAVGPAAVLILLAATYVLGARYGKRVGIAAALVMTASHPLFAALSVPAALVGNALWVVSVAAATGTKRFSVSAAGVTGGAAAVLQPALVPIGLFVTIFLLFRPERPPDVRMRSAATCAGLGLFAALLTALAPLTRATAEAGVLVTTRLWLAPAALFLSAGLLIPGAFTTLLMACAVLAVAAPFLPPLSVLAHGAAPFAGFAIGIVVVLAAFDALWRRSRGPAPRAAFAVAAVILGGIVLFSAAEVIG